MTLSRKPMARGTSEMKRSAPLKAKKPMNRGTVQLARAAKPMKQRSKTNAKRESGGEDKLCRGQACYLRIPGLCLGPASPTVPCHSNQSIHGKGMGIKAHDIYTVPGCSACHRETDQGMRFTREEKFAIWDRAYTLWAAVRATINHKENIS